MHPLWRTDFRRTKRSGTVRCSRHAKGYRGPRSGAVRTRRRLGACVCRGGRRRCPSNLCTASVPCCAHHWCPRRHFARMSLFVYVQIAACTPFLCGLAGPRSAGCEVAPSGGPTGDRRPPSLAPPVQWLWSGKGGMSLEGLPSSESWQRRARGSAAAGTPWGAVLSRRVTVRLASRAGAGRVSKACSACICKAERPML